MKWEDKLLGCRFTLVTDHKGLEYFETQKNLLDRQVRWWEFLSHFNYTIMHVGGVDNKVADCLSHYYENNMSDDTHSENTYVNTDIWLYPDGKLLPTHHYMEMCTAETRWLKCLGKREEPCHIEAEILNASDVNTQTQAHAQIHTHTQIHTHAQIPAYVQLPALLQPHVPS